MRKDRVVMIQAVAAIVTILAADPEREIEVELHGKRLWIRMVPSGEILSKDAAGRISLLDGGSPSPDIWTRIVRFLAADRDPSAPYDAPLVEANRLATVCAEARIILDKALGQS